MHYAPLLIAAGFDWGEVVGGSAALIIWVLYQVINVIRAAGQRQPEPPAAPPRPQQRRPPAPAPGGRRGGEPQADLERQIEEFLRGTKGRDRGPPPRRGSAAADTSPAPRPARSRVEPPSLPRREQQPSGSRGDREARGVGVREATGGDVARHVADAFAHQLDHLPAGLTGAEVGQERRSESPTVAAELAMALRSPQTLRQLILLREVLDRPTERW